MIDWIYKNIRLCSIAS